MKKRLVIENWYRFMNEDTSEDPIDKLLKDMEEESPEAFAAMQAELATYDVDPHEVPPDQLYKVFDKYAAEKETNLMTNRGTNPFDFDQKKFNQRFDVTGDNKFDLNDVLELGNKSIPYGIYMGSKATGGFKDQQVSTKGAKVKAISAPGIFRSLSDINPAQTTAPYLIVYMIPVEGRTAYYIFDPEEAFSMGKPSEKSERELNQDGSVDEIVDMALRLCNNFIPSGDFFSFYSANIDEEIKELTALTAKSSIEIDVVETGDKSILGQMLLDAQSWADTGRQYITATDIKVSIGGSIGFDQRMDDLLFVLNHMPMLVNATFVLRGVMTGGQQKKLMAMLDKAKPHYNYKFESKFFEENSLMEDYELVQQIKRAKDGR